MISNLAFSKVATSLQATFWHWDPLFECQELLATSFLFDTVGHHYCLLGLQSTGGSLIQWMPVCSSNWRPSVNSRRNLHNCASPFTCIWWLSNFLQEPKAASYSILSKIGAFSIDTERWKWSIPMWEGYSLTYVHTNSSCKSCCKLCGVLGVDLSASTNLDHYECSS